MLANLDKRQSFSNYIETLTAGNFTSIEVSGNRSCYYATICGPLPRIRYQQQGQVTGMDNTMVVGAPFELFEV